ncbi:MAG: glycosyltransferase, partial [Actinomycetota bacterium]
MKILIIGSNDAYLRIPLAEVLRDRGWQVAIAGDCEANLFHERNIEFWRYSFHSGYSIAHDLRALAQLTRICRQARPDVVHALSTKPALLSPPAARLARVPVVVRTVTGLGHLFASDSYKLKLVRSMYRLAQRFASRLSDWTIFQNPSDQDYFLQSGLVQKSKQGLILSSGIDVEAFRAAWPAVEQVRAAREELGLGQGTVVTMVSRIVPEKGVWEFLEAGRILASKGNSAQLLLVGPIMGAGSERITEAGVRSYGDVVRYAGYRADIPTVLALSDLLVLPSYYREGVPRVLLEGGLAGLPLITSDMPGCREVVVDGWNGYLVPPRNPEALADRIVDVVKDESKRAGMGRRSRVYVKQRFDLRSVAAAYADFYAGSDRDSEGDLGGPDGGSAGACGPGASETLSAVAQAGEGLRHGPDPVDVDGTAHGYGHGSAGYSVPREKRLLLVGANDRAALSACRSAGRLGYEVELLKFSTVRSAVEASRCCRKVHYLGNPTAGVGDYVDRLLGLLERRHFSYLLPTNDAANELVYHRHAEVARHTVVLGPSVEAYRVARDKARALEIAAEAGLLSPPGVRVESVAFGGPITFPAYVKPIYSAHIADDYLHTFKVRRVRTPQELAAKLRDTATRIPVLVQEPVAGHGVGLNLCAYGGALCAAGVNVRVHEPRHGGGSSYRRTAPVSPALLQAASSIARQLNWSGVMMVELKYDGSD